MFAKDKHQPSFEGWRIKTNVLNITRTSMIPNVSGSTSYNLKAGFPPKKGTVLGHPMTRHYRKNLTCGYQRGSLSFSH